MGRSAEDDRDVLALPLQRPRRHVSNGGTPTRVHPPSFDPAAARKAWRQVARVRGGGPGLGVDPGRRRPGAPALLGVLLALGVVWAMWSLNEPARDTAPPIEVAAATATDAERVEQTASPTATPSATPAVFTPTRMGDEAEAERGSAVPMPASSIGSFTPKTAARIAPPATEDASQQSAPKLARGSTWRSAIPMPTPEPSAPPPPAIAQAPGQPAPAPALPPVRRGPAVSPDTPAAGVAALKKLPKGSRDRPPLEGVGSSGIHVDRLDLGSSYDKGVCQGSNRSYAASSVKTVNVCFRAVHRRQTERVLVKWSKNGRLVRRAWIVIPAAHAYRTRAGLRLRDSHVGNWTVSVESTDGIVLASGDFKVTR